MNNLEDNLEDNISSKKLFIYNKINDLSINSNILIDYVIFNKLKYTKNKNGIFLNLYSVSDDHINKIYDMIINKINYNKLINSTDYEFKNSIDIDKYNPNIINYENNEFKEIDDNLFDDYDIDLIGLSKKII